MASVYFFRHVVHICYYRTQVKGMSVLQTVSIWDLINDFVPGLVPVAEHVVVRRMVHMVLDAISVFEDASTQVAEVLMTRCLFDVRENRVLVRKLHGAHTAPVHTKPGSILSVIAGF